MEDAPTPQIETPDFDLKSMQFLKEYSKKGKENQEEYKITLGIIDSYIKIIIKEGINTYNCQFNLNDLQTKNKYFRMFDSIEETFKEILMIFNENQYNIKIEENNLILNIEIDISHKKNIIPFILEKNEIKKEELIQSLYKIANNYIKENNGLKEDINKLNNKMNKIEEKLNSIENKINIIINHINNKKEEKEEDKEKEKLVNFESVLGESKIVEKEQISLLKDWLPFNKNKIKCKLIYNAKRDGDKASTFHSLCDNKESTLTIISTSDNKKIGGYLSKPFGGNKEFISDNNAFLFSLNYKEKYLSLNKGKNYYDLDNKGPIFGFFCIYINDNFFINNKNFYSSYTNRYDFGKRDRDEKNYFKVNDLETYQIFE